MISFTNILSHFYHSKIILHSNDELKCIKNLIQDFWNKIKILVWKKQEQN